MDRFDFPPTVALLDDVPADCRPLYEQDETGAGFRLTAEAVAEVELYRQKVGAMEAAHAEAVGKRVSRVASQDAQIAELLTTSALGAAVDAARVPTRFQRGAVARLREKLDIVVEPSDGQADGHVLSVRDAFGPMTVERAVQNWLASEDGRPFRPAETRPGPFLKLVQDL